MDADALTEVLEKLRSWQPFNGGAALDDIATALDDLPPAEDDVEHLVRRIRGHLIELVDTAKATEGDDDASTATLIQRACTLIEQAPADHQQAVLHLRRMGFVASELFDWLVEQECLKEAAWA